MRNKSRIALIFLIALIVVVITSCKEEDITQLVSGKARILCDNNGEYSLFASELNERLQLHNISQNEITVTVFSENGKSAVISAEANGDGAAQGPEGKLSALRVDDGLSDMSYALSAAGLTSLLDAGVPEIILLCDITYDGSITINHPVEILGEKGSLSLTDNILYITEESGTLSLSENVSAASFAAAAPNSIVNLPRSLVPENPALAVNAKKLNDITLAPGLRVVKSEDELKLLLDGSEALALQENEFIKLCNFSFDSELTINKAINLYFDGCETNEKLSIQTDDEGQINIKGDVAAKDININAPECSLVWENNPPTIATAASLYKIKALNGHALKDFELGGDLSLEITAATLSSAGKLLTENITWSLSGNTLVADFDGVAAPSELQNAQLNFSANGQVAPEEMCAGEGGTVNLLCDMGCYVRITDGNGSYRRYNIITNIKTRLPVVTIETEDGKEVTSKEEYLCAYVTVDSSYTDKLPSTEKSKVQIKGRGNSSWSWADKKPYKLKFDKSVSLLGLSSGNDWVLVSNYADKSLIRNYVALEGAKVLDNMDAYATQYPVDVFMGGKYIGVYTMGEQIEEGSNRVQLKTNASTIDTGYLLEVGGTDEVVGPGVFSLQMLKYIKIIEPNEKSLSEAEQTYITNYFILANNAVYSLSNYDNYIDVDSLIDWYIMTEFSFNTDSCMRRSVYITKDSGGKLKFGNVWDFDLAFGNGVIDYNNYNAWACLATDKGYVYTNWMCHLMKDKAFVLRLKNRWNEVKGELFRRTLAAAEYGYEIVSPSAAPNFKVWDVLNWRYFLQPENITSYNTYELQIEYLIAFINNRYKWIDLELNK